jgi:hypothetical protein
MRKVLSVAIALFSALLLPLGYPIEAQSPPHVFVGQATIDGVPVPDGTIIRAVVNGEYVPKAETAVQDGKYAVIVEQPKETGTAEAAIGFVVGDYPAQQSGYWKMGEATHLDLTASSALPAVPVVISPTLPERLARGEEFTLTIKADTGLYKASGGKVVLNFDPQVMIVNMTLPPKAVPVEVRVSGNIRR